MKSRPTPVTPDALGIGQALQRSATLARLRALIGESNERFAAIRALLPPALVAHVRPGPIDDTGWSLLAANASVAAKLRQLQPRLEGALLDQGWPARSIRVKVQAG